jgi:hypothetical protein
MKIVLSLAVAALAAAAFSAYLQPAMLVGFAYLRLLCG